MSRSTKDHPGRGSTAEAESIGREDIHAAGQTADQVSGLLVPETRNRKSDDETTSGEDQGRTEKTEKDEAKRRSAGTGR